MAGSSRGGVIVISAAWLDQLRREGMERFRNLGFPTTDQEDWRFTNVSRIREAGFQPEPVSRKTALPSSVRSLIDSLPEPALIFVDGLPAPGGRRASYARTLSEAFADPSCVGVLHSHFGRYADTSANAFAAWNTALFADGACVVVPDGVVVEQPIHLVFVSTVGAGRRVIFPRNLIIVGEQAEASLIETYLSASAGTYLNNAVTEIIARPGAILNYSKVQRESSESFHIASINAMLDRDAVMKSHSFSLGAALSRNDLRVSLAGEGAQCALDGLFLADKDRLADNHTAIDHCMPHTTSRESYKGILAGRGQGVFNGAIIVRKGAQKTDADQRNKNLILSDNAQINTKPQLEIRADDVRCSHGASIGQIDEEALFYLKTRGLDQDVARKTLVRAFAAEIIEGVRNPRICRQLDGWLDEWFHGSLEAA